MLTRGCCNVPGATVLESVPTPLPCLTARLRTGCLAIACAAALAGSGANAGDLSDPFNTRDMRPGAASQFWPGPGTGPVQGQAGAVTCQTPVKLPESLRLADAIDLALCNNPLTRQSWASAKVQAAALGVARSAYLPEVNLDGSVRRTEVRNTQVGAGSFNIGDLSLSLNYLLFDFGGREANVDLARESLEAANWTHNATLQDVILNAVSSYYGVYATQEAVVSTQQAEKASQSSLEAARARLRVGSATRADVLQAQTAFSQAQLNRTQAEGDAANARGILANALGFEADRPLQIAAPPDIPAQKLAEQAVGQRSAMAKAKRPDLAAAQAQVRAAQSNIRVQEAAGKPSLSAFASLDALQSSPGADPRSGAVGLQLNIPLFTGFRNTYQIRQAREQVEVQTASRDKLASDVTLDVWRSYQDLTTQRQALMTATELVASAQENYNVALARYKAGVGNIIDLLNAQTALASAQLQRIQANYRWNLAKATLARAIGMLEPALLPPAARGEGQAPR